MPHNTWLVIYPHRFLPYCGRKGIISACSKVVIACDVQSAYRNKNSVAKKSIITCRTISDIECNICHEQNLLSCNVIKKHVQIYVWSYKPASILFLVQNLSTYIFTTQLKRRDPLYVT